MTIYISMPKSKAILFLHKVIRFKVAIVTTENYIYNAKKDRTLSTIKTFPKSIHLKWYPARKKNDPHNTKCADFSNKKPQQPRCLKTYTVWLRVSINYYLFYHTLGGVGVRQRLVANSKSFLIL